MNLGNHSKSVTAVLGLLAIWNVAVADAEEMTISPRDADSGVFGDTRVERVYRIQGQNQTSAVLGWSLVSQRRILARGETPFTIDSSGSAEVSVPLAVPPVNPGVILKAELKVSVYGGAFEGEAAAHRRPLWIFPRDAFAGRSQWLRSLEIVLFDPAGDTAAVFDRAAIPYRRITRPQQLDSGGLAVVGEGLAIDQHAGLASAIFTAAQCGKPVLWLAPAAGRFALPGASENSEAIPQAMLFHDLDILAELDERLDRDIWAAPGRGPSLMALRCHQASVVVEIGTGQGDWPWFQMQYAEPAAKLVVCGPPLIASWQESPTPRFLLLRILETLDHD